ncbi:fibronectin type III-like domain-contianing protein [Yinghuangia sp. YIM S10712]|uniref:fibronectin type III-like domain-contianing protein n=1 Tax=Yinghuangia sp. YIM S10712 TaxID=3436930 RepID=UPI003F531D51
MRIDPVDVDGQSGFSRVELVPGESRHITFKVAAAQLGYTNVARDFTVRVTGMFAEGAHRPLQGILHDGEAADRDHQNEGARRV